MILTDSRERTRFFRFAVVGTIGAVIDFGVFNLMIFLGMRAIIASAISFIAAVISNFLWNRYWTYPDSRSKSLTRQMVQFLLVSLVGLGIRAGLFAILETPLIRLFEKIGWKILFSASFLGHNLTLAIAILIVLLWNFLANRYWTYNDVGK
jgi:putative flippase GtrA